MLKKRQTTTNNKRITQTTKQTHTNPTPKPDVFSILQWSWLKCCRVSQVLSCSLMQVWIAQCMENHAEGVLCQIPRSIVLWGIRCSSCEANGKPQKLSRAFLGDINYPNNRQAKDIILTFSSMCCCGLNSDALRLVGCSELLEPELILSSIYMIWK